MSDMSMKNADLLEKVLEL